MSEGLLSKAVIAKILSSYWCSVMISSPVSFQFVILQTHRHLKFLKHSKCIYRKSKALCEETTAKTQQTNQKKIKKKAEWNLIWSGQRKQEWQHIITVPYLVKTYKPLSENKKKRKHCMETDPLSLNAGCAVIKEPVSLSKTKDKNKALGCFTRLHPWDALLATVKCDTVRPVFQNL